MTLRKWTRSKLNEVPAAFRYTGHLLNQWSYNVAHQLLFNYFSCYMLLVQEVSDRKFILIYDLGLIILDSDCSFIISIGSGPQICSVFATQSDLSCHQLQIF